MQSESNQEWLGEYLTQSSDLQNQIAHLEKEISENFAGQLSSLGKNIQLVSNPMPMVNVDPFNPFHQHRVIEEIADIYKFATPYINLSTQALVTLHQASGARKNNQGSSGSWSPPNYATQIIADQQTGKMTSIAHADQWNTGGAAHSNCLLEYTTHAMDKDYSSLAIVFNYFLDYRLEYEFNPAKSFQFSQQKVILNITVKEYYASGLESGRAVLPSQEDIYKYEHDFTAPKAQSKFSAQLKPKQHLKRILIPTVKKGSYYKVLIELFTYSWLVDGRAANEANFVLVPMM